MITLKILGLFALIILCFGLPITLTVDAVRKPKPTRIESNGKRELKINRINFWESLIIIIPVCLVLIGLLTNDRTEKLTSFTIVGVGFSYLILSPYNNRIGITWVNRTILIVSLTLFGLSYLLPATQQDFKLQSGFNSLAALRLPIIIYLYLISARELIKVCTKTYPITLDKYFRVGHFSHRFSRKATYWDHAWSLWNIGGIPIIVIYFLILFGDL